MHKCEHIKKQICVLGTQVCIVASRWVWVCARMCIYLARIHKAFSFVCSPLVQHIVVVVVVAFNVVAAAKVYFRKLNGGLRSAPT